MLCRGQKLKKNKKKIGFKVYVFLYTIDKIKNLKLKIDLIRLFNRFIGYSPFCDIAS